MSYLTGYLDLALPVREGETQDSILREEHERLNKLLSVATIAQTIPRRVGPEAGPDELAEDKRRAKRIAHVAQQLLLSWGGRTNGTISDASREAAAVNWADWWASHEVWLMNRRMYIATWSYKNNGDEKWAKSAIVKLNNELRWMTNALR